MAIDRGFANSVEFRAQRMNEANETLPFRGAIFTKVLTGSGDTERVKVDTVAGDKIASFAYPFASKSAWIRGQPEPSTTMISILGGDTLDLQPIAYYDPAKSGAAATYRNTTAAIRQAPSQDVDSGILPYRSLVPGELDIGSGFAQVFLGKKDVYQARGGLSHFTMESREAKLETPLFSIKGPAHQLSSALSDEVRFGTVRRDVANNSGSTASQQSLIQHSQTNQRDATQPLFAKEATQIITWFGSPSTLIDHRQGHVVNDNGSLATSTQTNKQLRARFNWFSEQGQTKAEVDINGNTIFKTSEDATEGLFLAVPAGNILAKVGNSTTGKVTLQSTKDIQLSTDTKFSVIGKEGFRVISQQKGEIKADAGLGLSSNGTININTPTTLGVTIGDRNAVKYPALVAHPEYIAGLTSYYSAQTAHASATGAYGIAAAAAWAAIGPLCMILDPSGVIMGLCQAAGAAAGVIAGTAPPVSAAVSTTLPKINQMPNGFMSRKLTSE